MPLQLCRCMLEVFPVLINIAQSEIAQILPFFPPSSVPGLKDLSLKEGFMHWLLAYTVRQYTSDYIYGNSLGKLKKIKTKNPNNHKLCFMLSYN